MTPSILDAAHQHTASIFRVEVSEFNPENRAGWHSGNALDLFSEVLGSNFFATTPAILTEVSCGLSQSLPSNSEIVEQLGHAYFYADTLQSIIQRS
jgi:hypothetical protein